MSAFEANTFRRDLKIASADSEDQTVRSGTSSDYYGDVLPDAWGSLDEADENQNSEIEDFNEDGISVKKNAKIEGETNDEENTKEQGEKNDEEEEMDEVDADDEEGKTSSNEETIDASHVGTTPEDKSRNIGDLEEDREDDEEGAEEEEEEEEEDSEEEEEDEEEEDDEEEAEEEDEAEEEEAGDVDVNSDEEDSNDENFHCDMSLEEIQKELRELAELAHKGLPFSERRLDYLLKAQEHDPEYRSQQEEENEEWLESIEDFTAQCLERTRTFIPVNVFSSTQDSLVAMGLSEELAKRILQRKCLWLVRMSSAEIAGLHQADLYGRYNTTAQHLDIIETAAIYASLPRRFNNDKSGKKREWRKTIEDNLKQMLMLNDNDQLPAGKIRNAAYSGLQYGPVKDTESVRENHITTTVVGEKEAFAEICRGNSILRDMKDI